MSNAKNTPDHAESKGAPEDIKAKFREALAKKNSRNSGPREDHLDGHSKAQGPHGPAGGPQDFRRKTG
ncbi:DUF5302 domain-containing protein [Falsarthrobacter nasiphocae]|uniref:DUF5302 domain-containing protein n=1 Tax=Falsarthrobacter nasiphocae TaxID=189863 RepID=A0AAE3YDR4_9MICC|nr:DUF5302 domain-containing protein [Falsarthrobacter nasiphocae]MDR6891509.1 hypothetical protein [Falsarthrobacter nasiphocae]